MGRGKMSLINEEEGGKKACNKKLILAICFSYSAYAFLKFTSIL